MNNKTSITSIIIFLSFIIAGDIGGYSIFEYSNKAFEINRVYFQYTDDLSDDLFLKIRYDVARDGVDATGAPTKDGKFVAYLKNAYVDWSCKNGGLLSLGLIGTNSYGVQENTWGYRFIEKSSMDLRKFTNTADLGIGYSHNFGNFNINAQLLNGEGYKSKQSDDHMATYLRVMYGESKLNKNDGYNIGVVMTTFEGDGALYDSSGEACTDVDIPDGCNANYGDEITAAEEDDASLIGLFGGWSSNKLRLGVEYNQYESWNDVAEGGLGALETQTINSLYANYSISDKLDIFVKHDMGEWWVKNDDDDDILTPDQSISWIGMVCNPSKGLYVSPNVVIEDGANDYRLTFMFKY